MKKKYSNPYRVYKHDKVDSRDRVREKIRMRDKYRCQICKKKWDLGMRRFDVHHKDFNKEKTRQYNNYEIEKDNMITLCHKCHLNLPEHKASMSAGHKNLSTDVPLK